MHSRSASLGAGSWGGYSSAGGASTATDTSAFLAHITESAPYMQPRTSHCSAELPEMMPPRPPSHSHKQHEQQGCHSNQLEPNQHQHHQHQQGRQKPVVRLPSPPTSPAMSRACPLLHPAPTQLRSRSHSCSQLTQSTSDQGLGRSSSALGQGQQVTTGYEVGLPLPRKQARRSTTSDISTGPAPHSWGECIATGGITYAALGKHKIGTGHNAAASAVAPAETIEMPGAHAPTAVCDWSSQDSSPVLGAPRPSSTSSLASMRSLSHSFSSTSSVMPPELEGIELEEGGPEEWFRSTLRARVTACNKLDCSGLRTTTAPSPSSDISSPDGTRTCGSMTPDPTDLVRLSTAEQMVAMDLNPLWCDECEESELHEMLQQEGHESSMGVCQGVLPLRDSGLPLVDLQSSSSSSDGIVANST